MAADTAAESLTKGGYKAKIQSLARARFESLNTGELS